MTNRQDSYQGLALALPLELIHSVIDELGFQLWCGRKDASLALRSIALCSHHLYSYASGHRFSTLHITNFEQTFNLIEGLRRNPIMARKIRRLRLRRKATRDPYEDMWTSNSPPLDNLIPLLPGISSLEIVDECSGTPRRLTRAWDIFSEVATLTETGRLTSLVLTDVLHVPKSLLFSLGYLRSLTLNNIQFSETTGTEIYALPKQNLALEALRITGSVSVFQTFVECHASNSLAFPYLRFLEVSSAVHQSNDQTPGFPEAFIQAVGDSLLALTFDAHIGKSYASCETIPVYAKLDSLYQLQAIRIDVPASKIERQPIVPSGTEMPKTEPPPNLVEVATSILSTSNGNPHLKTIHLVTTQAVATFDYLLHLKLIQIETWRALEDAILGIPLDPHRPYEIGAPRSLPPLGLSRFPQLEEVVLEVQVERFGSAGQPVQTAEKILLLLQKLRNLTAWWFTTLTHQVIVGERGVRRLRVKVKVNDVYAVLGPADLL